MNDKSLNILEYDKVLDELINCVRSVPSKEFCLNLRPSFDLKQTNTLLNQTSEAYLINNKYLLNPIVEFDNINEIVLKAKIGSTLNPSDLLKVGRLIRSGRIAQRNVLGTGQDICLLKEIVSSYFVDVQLEDEINNDILNENEVSDNASEKLRTIRRNILAAKNKLKDKLNTYTRNSNISKYLQDNLVTIRNGRYVLPVRADFKGEVPGLIHDRSATGSTLFIEPYPVVELNNEIKALELDEQIEIERLLKELSDWVSRDSEALTKCQNALIMLDIIFAKVKLAEKQHAIRPEVNDEGEVKLINSRHPLIDPAKVVPVTISVGEEFRILTITGPNTGGKTVSLKTVGLLSLMAMTGMYVPCDENSKLSVFDDVFCDIGDEQSIQESLSTFSSHMTNIVYITESITRNSLVLLDEIGGGTDPMEGAALAVGILKYIEQVGSCAIITTHYSELKEYALISKNINNACMQFDEATMRPTYKLIMGLPGTSNALLIAENLGINPYILQAARENIRDDKIRFESILHQAEATKSAALRELEELQNARNDINRERALIDEDRKKLAEKLNKLNVNAKLELKRIIGNSIDEANELIDQLKQTIKAGDEKALIEAHRLRKKLDDMQYSTDIKVDMPRYEKVSAEEIKIGDQVVVIKYGNIATVKTNPNSRGEVLVSMGAISSKVKIEEIGKVVDLSNNKSDNKNHKRNVEMSKKSNENAEHFYLIPELNLLGQTVDDAITIIEPYIISMYNENAGKTLKLIHGKGTGALSSGLHKYLKSNNMVKEFRYGGYGEGDRGVTFVEIK